MERGIRLQYINDPETQEGQWVILMPGDLRTLKLPAGLKVMANSYAGEVHFGKEYAQRAIILPTDHLNAIKALRDESYAKWRARWNAELSKVEWNYFGTPFVGDDHANETRNVSISGEDLEDAVMHHMVANPYKWVQYDRTTNTYVMHQ